MRNSGPHWPAPANGLQPSGRAQTVLDCLQTQGASFFDELTAASGLLPSQVEEALGELVALGPRHIGQLRRVARAAGAVAIGAGRSPAERRRRRIISFGMEDAGRWALMRRPPSEAAEPQANSASIEHVARTLLRRYGVVFWRLLAREADWLPPWRDLLRVYRRLEARGEIRGGRFVAGFSGEQYALPDAIGLLREVRRRPHSGEFDLAVRRGSAQPCRYPDARRETCRADRKPAAVPRWLAGGLTRWR